jgi:hypothetical protein
MAAPKSSDLPCIFAESEPRGNGSGHKKGLIAPCDVLAVQVDRPAKLKSSALAALSIGLIPSSSSWL